jgi:hypothetical protein
MEGEMGFVRRLVSAFAVAGILAAGLGTVSVEAKGKPGSPDGQSAICSYLESVLAYPYLSPWIQKYVLELWARYGCGA